MLDSLLRAPEEPSGGPFLRADSPSVVTTDIESPAPARARPLADLLDGIRGREVRVVGDASVLIRDVAYRSSETRPGSLFFCVPGGHLDGHDFAEVACRAGAAAVVAERELGVPCTQVLVPSVRQVMGPLSAAFFSFPADRMTVVAVTGTNGKTTTTYLLESIFRMAGLVPGVIGTTGVRLAGEPVPFDRTTPEAPDLQRLLSRMLEGGVRAVAMEASSHGLEQHRVDGTRYACAVFTNLTQDHLDYHLTMEAYFEAKARLFTPDLSLRGVVNADTREGRVLVARAEVPVVTFGVDAESNPTVKAEDVEVSASGVRFAVDGIVVRSHLRGTFNVYNCLGAYAAARQVDIAPSIAAEGIEALRGVPGRMEPVEVGQAFPVLVDYAHTPDSVENVLEAARALGPGRLIVVFGCGGDRDRGKRPLMGEAATRLADLTVITSDNPRSEEPAAIIAEIEPGARRGGGRYVVEPDRREAIRLAVGEAVEGDVVVIAGKGHETGQVFEGGRAVPFDDRLVAADALAERLGGIGR